MEDLIIGTVASVAPIASQRISFSYRDLDKPGKASYVEASIPLESANDVAMFTGFVEGGNFAFDGPGYARSLYGALQAQVYHAAVLFDMDYALIDTAAFKSELHGALDSAGLLPADVLAISLVEGSIIANVTLRTKLVADQLRVVVNNGAIAMGDDDVVGVFIMEAEKTTTVEADAVLTAATPETPDVTTLVPITVLDLNSTVLQLMPTDLTAGSTMSYTNWVVIITASILVIVIIVVLLISRHHTTQSEQNILKRVSPFDPFNYSTANNPLAAPYSPDPKGKFSSHFYPGDGMLPRFNRESVKKRVSAGGRASSSLSPISQTGSAHDYFDPLPGPFGLLAAAGGADTTVDHPVLRPQGTPPHIGLERGGSAHYYPKESGFVGRESLSPQVMSQGSFATAAHITPPSQQQPGSGWGEAEAMLLRASQSPPRTSFSPGGILINSASSSTNTLSPIAKHHQQMQHQIRAQQALQQVGLSHLEQGHPGHIAHLRASLDEEFEIADRARGRYTPRDNFAGQSHQQPAITMFGAPTPGRPAHRRPTHNFPGLPTSPTSPGYIDVQDMSMGLDLSGGPGTMDEMHHEFLAFEKYLLDAGPAAAIAAANAKAATGEANAEYLAF